jgi:PadR family transcriptional regulator, regulatory protein PadR
MRSKTNFTRLEIRLLSVFHNHLDRQFYGLQLAEELRISYGSVLPILMRFEEAGWLETDWENIDPSVAGRPKRKYYHLSNEGKAKAKELVQTEIRFLRGEVQTI